MVKPKAKSKRTPVRLRHKIEKASASKQRKQRKLAKQNPQWRSRLKKDPGIPNLFPFKDRILHEIEEKKRLKAEEAIRIREEARAGRDGRSAVDGDGVQQATNVPEEYANLVDEDMEEEDYDESNPMAALLASAKARAAEYDGQEDDESLDDMDEDSDEVEVYGGVALDDEDSITAVEPSRKDTSRRAFDKVFKQVISAADVILYVLDARDPDGTRSKEVEREIMAAEAGSKRLILILNKIDLVPPPVLKAWLLHLRRYFPTLPLRASNPAPNAHTFNHKQLTVKGTSETLLRALKSYAHSKQLKRSIAVGIIGYPNVGKSSVINALTSRLNKGSSSACPVGAEAGVTTNLREVKLDNKLKLLDSPGIVFPSSKPEDNTNKSRSRSDHQARLILLSAIPPKQISDPVPAVSLLLSRLSSSPDLYSKLLSVYGIPPLVPSANGDTTTDFLIQVARKRGRLGKGGVPNLNSAAMTIVTDWRDGRISGWVEAPTLLQIAANGTEDGANGGVKANTEGADTKEIVSEWAKEFKLEGLWGNGVDGDDNGGEEEVMQE